jgi:peptide/nickel transport system permease protein
VIGFLLQRLGHAVLVLLVVSVLAFSLSSLVGDPIASILGLDATPADQVVLRARLHLNDPLPMRYVEFVGNAVAGNFGISYSAQRPVADVVVERLPATVELAVVALLLSMGAGVPLGIYAAIRPRARLARALMSASIIGVALPTFVFAILAITLFSVVLGWLPSFGRGDVVRIGWWTTGLVTRSGLLSLILPAISLAIGQVALVARLVRAEMMDVLRADYIRFARARGVPDRLIHFSHALRNTLVPIITVSGIQLGFLVAFDVVVESVFQWPGLGLLILQALGSADVPVISAFLLMTAVFFVAINLVVDILYGVVDPRLRAVERPVAGA